MHRNIKILHFMLMLNYIAAFPSSWRISFPCSLMLMLMFCFSRSAVNARIPCRVTPALNSLVFFTHRHLECVAGAVSSWLVCSSLERVVWVRALAGDMVLCFWARHFTLTVPLSTQVYKWIPTKLMLGSNHAMD